MPASDDRTRQPTRRPRRPTLRSALPQLLGLLAFLPVASRAPLYVRLLWALAQDDRTPLSRKALLAGAAGYVALGRDLIADDVPFLGGLDDLIVVVVAVDLFFDGVPPDVLDEKLDSLGIDRAAFAEDIGRIRRLTPRPVRRTIRRVPDVAGLAVGALRRSGVAARTRRSAAKEESLA